MQRIVRSPFQLLSIILFTFSIFALIFLNQEPSPALAQGYRRICDGAPFIWPMDDAKRGWVWNQPVDTSYVADGTHDGLDLIPLDESVGQVPIYAIHSGTLTRQNYFTLLLQIEIEDNYNVPDHTVWAYMTHMGIGGASTIETSLVEKFDNGESEIHVNRGDKLGTVGNVGSEGLAHLHISILSDPGEFDHNIDPSPYFGDVLNWPNATDDRVGPPFRCTNIDEEHPIKLASVTPKEDPPYLQWPPDGWLIDDSLISFDWIDVEDAVSYDVVIGNIETTSPDSDILFLSYRFGEYTYWKVRAVFSNGSKGPWSEERLFTRTPIYGCFEPPFDLFDNPFSSSQTDTLTTLTSNEATQTASCITPPNTPTCPSDENGLYCGGTALVGGDSNTLYNCTNGSYTVNKVCSQGCLQNPQGTADACAQTTIDYCQTIPWGGAGPYCKGDTLVNCGPNRTTVSEVTCGYGCQENPLFTPDSCRSTPNDTPSFEGSAKLYQEQNYKQLVLEVSNVEKTSNAPSKDIRSIAIPDEWSFRIWDADDKQGSSRCWDESVQNLQDHEEWQARIESIEVYTYNDCGEDGGGEDEGPHWDAYFYDGDSKWWDPNIPTSSRRCYKKIEGETLDADFGTEAPCGGGSNPDNWVAEFKATRKFEDKDYVFIIEHDDGLQIFVNDQQRLIRSGRGQSTVCPEIHMNGDTDLKFLLREDGGDANVHVTWSDDISACADVTPPSGEMTLPLQNAHTNSTDPLILEANAYDDDSGVLKVEFYLKSDSDWNNSEWTFVGDAASAPYTYNLNTSALPEGNFWVAAKVYDNEGNETDILDDENYWTNFTVDRTNPTAIMNPIGDTNDFKFQVSWSGNDTTTPVSQLHYDVQYQENCNGDWKNWVNNRNVVEESFLGIPSETYCFRNRSHDLAANTSEWSNSEQVTLPACKENEFVAEYFNNSTLSGDPVLVQCESKIDHSWGDTSPIVKGDIHFGDGSDGDYGGGNPNTVKTYITAPIDLGDTRINVNDSTGFSIGDEVLIIQMQGGSAGTYEFGDLVNTGTGFITVNLNIEHSYSNPTQIVRVPQFETVTGNISTDEWDGKTGGIVIFRAHSINSANINVSGKGFKGGWGNDSAIHEGGINCGSSWGTQGASPTSNGGCSGSPNGGGGGAGHDGHISGAGGGYGSGGQNTGASGGTIYGAEDLSTLHLGSGGGGGSWNTNPYGGGRRSIQGNDFSGQGAGSALIFGQDIQNINVNAEGNVGGKSYSTDGHGCSKASCGYAGGGGSGGAVRIAGQSVTLGNVNALGGEGGEGGDANGGHGGDGRVAVSYCTTLSGQSEPSAFTETNCGQDHFSVRWSGIMNFDPANYTFLTKADDGIRVWVSDDETFGSEDVIIDDWQDGYSEQSTTTYVGSNTNIKVEYYEKTDNAEAHVLIIPGFNQPPTLDPIPEQTAPVGEGFSPLDLSLYAHDPDFDFLNWRYEGATDIQLSFDNNHFAHTTIRDNWEGEEEITLFVSDEWGQEASTTVHFRTTNLKAAFSADETAVLTNQDIHFTDESEDNPNAWEWDFNSDGIIDSTDQNPSWQYSNPGTYTVTLYVSNDDSSDDEVKIDYITVSAPEEGIDLVGEWDVVGAFVNWRGRQRIRGDFFVSNIGPTTTNSKVKVEYFLSTDNLFSADDTIVSSRKIRVGENKRIHISIDGEGGHYLFFVVDSKNTVDELNEENNIVMYRLPEIDLAGTITDIRTVSKQVNDIVTVDFTVEDLVDDISWEGGTIITFYVSDDDTYDDSDDFLGKRWVSAQDEAAVKKIVWRGQDLAGKYLIMHIDYRNYIPETNEDNNWVIVEIPLP